MQNLFESWRKFINEIAVHRPLATIGASRAAMEAHYSDRRKSIYKSYESGINRDPWIARAGLLRRKVFDESTPQAVVDAYYDEVILPQMARTVFTTKVREPEKGKPGGVYLGGEIFMPGDRPRPDTFQHELGHAIDHQINLHAAFVVGPPPGERGYRIKPQNKFSKYLRKDLPPDQNPLNPSYNMRSLGGWQKDIMGKAFSFPPELGGTNEPYEHTAATGREYTKVPHHGEFHEVYDSIIMLRQRQQRPYTAEDIKLFRQPDRGQMGTLFVKYGHSVSSDVINAVTDYSKEGLSDEEIAELLNRIAKADTTKTSRIAE